MDVGGTSPRMGEGTTPGMEEVESRLEQRQRTMQEQLSGATPGAVAEAEGEKARGLGKSTVTPDNPLNLLCFYASAFILGC